MSNDPNRPTKTTAFPSLGPVSKKVKSDLDPDSEKKYPADGLKSSFHGVVYQYKLLMLSIHRAREKKLFPFRVATEMIDAEKFDDIVILYTNNKGELTWRFIQAKHILEPKEKDNQINRTKLTSKSDDRFYVQKYFISFCKIKHNARFKDKRLNDFSIVTNTDFDEDAQSLFDLVNDLDEDEILYFESDYFKAKKYRLKSEFKEEVKQKIKEDLEDSSSKAKKMIDELNSIQKKLNTAKTSYCESSICVAFDKMKRTHVKADILKESNKVLDCLVMLDSYTNEYNELKQSRIKLNESKKEGLQRLDSLKKEVLDAAKKISENINRNSTPKELSKVENELKEIHNELINLIKNSPENPVEKKKKITENQLILIRNIQTEIESELKKYQKTFEDSLGNYRGNFDELLEEFFNKFYFVTNYPNEGLLEKLINEELRCVFNLSQPDMLGAEFQIKMIEFLKEYDKGEAYFCADGDVDTFFMKLKRQLSALMTFGSTITLTTKLRSFGIRFEQNLEKLRTFILSNDDEMRIFHISTQTTQLSAIKVLQTIESCAQYKTSDSFIFVDLGTLLNKDEREISQEENKIEDQTKKSDFKYKNPQEMILNGFKNEKSCNLLVIECQNQNKNIDKNIQNEFKRLHKNLTKTLDGNSLKKILFIAEEDDKFLAKFSIGDDENDQASFADLDSKSKEEILGRSVNLQNSENPVQLNRFIDTNLAEKVFDQFILSRFLDEKSIAIGDQKAFSSVGYEKDYYIERMFRLQIIKCEILQENSSELLFITGANREDLLKLRVEDGEILEYETEQNYMNGIIIPSSNHSSQDYGRMFENIGENANWLHYSGNRFIWKGRKGNAKLINEYISENTTNSNDGENSPVDIALLNEEYFSKSGENFLQKIIIVANDPGMGKSTVLTSLARRMKGLDDIDDGDGDDDMNGACDNRWIVRINLNDHTKKLFEHKEEFDTANAIEFVTEIAVPGGPERDPIIRFQQNLFKAGLNEIDAIQTPKIVLMFDGFDEISPGYKDKTMSLIKALKACQVTQIWVTTRVHMKEHLEQELQTPAIVLHHLSEDDQIQFSSKFWKWNLKFEKNSFSGRKCDKTYKDILDYFSEIKLADDDDDYTRQFKESILEIVNDFTLENHQGDLDGLRAAIDQLNFTEYIQGLNAEWEKSLRNSGMQFTVNPLHLKMLTEVVFRKKFQLPKEFGLFHLYDEFIKMKFDIYYKDKLQFETTIQGRKGMREKDRKSTHEFYRELAAQQFFDERFKADARPDSNELKRFDPSEWEEEEKQDWVRKGLLCLNNDRLEFIHRSFAEFFFSIYLIDNLENGQVQELLVSQILGADDFKLICQFFNDQILEKNEIFFENIKLTETAKGSIADRVLDEYEHGLTLLPCKIAIKNHRGIIKFLFNAIPSNDGLYENFLTVIFGNMVYSTFMHILHENTLSQLLDASSKLQPEIMKRKILYHYEESNNLLSHAIKECENFDQFGVILKFIAENQEILGDKFIKQFVFCSEVRGRLEEAFNISQDPKVAHLRLNSFKHNLPADFAHKIQAFLLENCLIESRLLHTNIYLTNEWTKEWFKTNPHSLVNLWSKFIIGPLEMHFIQKHIAESFKMLCESIDDPEICKELAIIFVYSNNSYDKVLKILLKDSRSLEHSSEIHTMLTSIQRKLDENKHKPEDLIGEIRNGNMKNILHVMAKYNQTEVVDKLFESLKDSPKILEELVLHRDSEETALQMAFRIGHEEFVSKLLKCVKSHLGENILEKVYLQLPKDNPGISMESDSSIKIINRNRDKISEKSISVAQQLDEAIRDENIGKVQQILNENTNDLEEILLIKNRDGKTALHVAAEHNQFEIVEILFDSVKKQPRIVKKMALEPVGRNDETAVHLAARLGHRETVETILNLFKNDRDVLRIIVTMMHPRVFDKYIAILRQILQWKKHNLGRFGVINLIIEPNRIIPNFLGEVRRVRRFFKMSLDINQTLTPFLRNIADVIFFEDVVLLSAYSDACNGPKMTVAELLKLVEMEDEERQKLKEIKMSFDVIERTKSELDEAIRERKLNDVQKITMTSSPLVLKAVLLARNKNGKTALHLAAENTSENQSEIIEELLDKLVEFPHFLEEILLKADRFQEDTALHRAAQLGQLETVQSLLNYSKNQKNEFLIIKTVTKRNGNGKTVLKVAFDGKQHQIVKAIFVFVDEQVPGYIIDLIEEIGIRETLKWTEENGYFDLKQRFLQRIGIEGLGLELNEARAQMEMGNVSNTLQFLIDYKENSLLTAVLFVRNNRWETLIDISARVNKYEALNWIIEHFKDNSNFLRSFMLSTGFSAICNTHFLDWVKNGIEKTIPGILKKVFTKNFSRNYSALLTHIESNNFDMVKNILSWTNANLDNTVLEDLLLATHCGSNILECTLAKLQKHPDETKELLELMFKLFEKHHNILDKLLLKSNENLLQVIAIEMNRTNNTWIKSALNKFKSKYDELPRPSLNSDSNVVYFNDEELDELRKQLLHFFKIFNKRAESTAKLSDSAMEQEEQDQRQLAVAGTSNESLSPFYNKILHLTNNKQLDELFDYLSLKELHSIGGTCELMRKLAGDYFKRNFATAEKFTHDDGIYTVYSDYEGVKDERTQTSGFNRFMINTSYYYDDSGPIRYLESHSDEFESLNEMYLVCTELGSENVKNLQKILAKVETVRIHHCWIKNHKVFYDIFLKFCKNLKNLSILDDPGNILSGNKNRWLCREYPKLESVYFDPGWATPIQELYGFLQLNPSIRNLTINSKFLWVNEEMFLAFNIQLDQLSIRDVENKYGDAVPRDKPSIYQLLIQLYENGFYKRLNFATDSFNQEYSHHLSSLNGLVKLEINKPDGTFDLSNFIHLRQLVISGELTRENVEMIATDLVNLEFLSLSAMTGNDISIIISSLPKLQKFIVNPSEGFLDLRTLNEQREKLFCARKVSIYVPQEVFMKTKWKVENGDINLNLIEMKRNCAENRELNY